MLYKRAMDISSRHPVEEGSPEEFLLVAIGNNLCSILVEVGRQDILHGILEFTVSIAPPDMEFFWSNAVLWRFSESRAAAAA